MVGHNDRCGCRSLDSLGPCIGILLDYLECRVLYRHDNSWLEEADSTCETVARWLPSSPMKRMLWKRPVSLAKWRRLSWIVSRSPAGLILAGDMLRMNALYAAEARQLQPARGVEA